MKWNSILNFFNWERYANKPKAPIPDKVWHDPWYFIGFGFGSGVLPAPGTMGTFAALPFYFVFRLLPWPIYLILMFLFFFMASRLLDRLSKELNIHDHPGLCLDEFIGIWFTLFLAPAGFFWIMLGVALFRFFDIVKPWPIRWLDQHVGGGFGMVLDDVAAGIISAIILQCIFLIYG